jgi:hypothetical protein
MHGNVILEHKSNYGKETIFNHGKEYTYVKIVEHVYNGDFLVMIKSVISNKSFLVNIEDKDFVVKFFNN